MPPRFIGSPSAGGGCRAASAWTDLDDPCEHAGVGLGQHAVAEVEDVARLACRRRRGPWSPPRSPRPTGARQIAGSRLPWTALPGPMRVRATESGTRQSTPTTSAPASAMRPEQLAGPDAEMDPGTPRSRHPLEHLARGRKGERRVVAGDERARPAVEELDRRGSGSDLGPQRRQGDVGEAVGELVPELGLGVHQGLRAGEGARRAALDRGSSRG